MFKLVLLVIHVERDLTRIHLLSLLLTGASADTSRLQATIGHVSTPVHVLGILRTPWTLSSVLAPK